MENTTQVVSQQFNVTNLKKLAYRPHRSQRLLRTARSETAYYSIAYRNNHPHIRSTSQTVKYTCDP
ncbi:hypothetical protein CLV84_2709 [Neolewinella xylanilytica]|uniref:Uncharacterized protein n=1 Tax=Neolewinella xylanilytica TaxID=1514080 RepID=A0A2S6I3N8_9BACT|nr:hypothetical protein CLV84_2709 [Neolewinella xylanilytica]